MHLRRSGPSPVYVAWRLANADILSDKSLAICEIVCLLSGHENMKPMKARTMRSCSNFDEVAGVEQCWYEVTNILTMGWNEQEMTNMGSC